MSSAGRFDIDREKAMAVVVQNPGMTGYEIDKLGGYSDGTLRRRLSELRAEGRVVNGRHKVCTVVGSECQTWWAADNPKVLTGEVRKAGKDFSVVYQRFDRFWNEYPRRVAKKPARIAFLKINPDEAMLDMMLESIKRYKGNVREKGGWKDAKTGKLIEPEFIPHPATWLNAERWNDELPPVVEQNKQTVEERIAFQRARFRTDMSDEERRKAEEVWKAFREKRHGGQNHESGVGQAPGGVAGEEHKRVEKSVSAQASSESVGGPGSEN